MNTNMIRADVWTGRDPKQSRLTMLGMLKWRREYIQRRGNLHLKVKLIHITKKKVVMEYR